MRRSLKYFAAGCAATAAVAVSVLLPPELAKWQDRALFGVTETEDISEFSAGFSYRPTLMDKLDLIWRNASGDPSVYNVNNTMTYPSDYTDRDAAQQCIQALEALNADGMFIPSEFSTYDKFQLRTYTFGDIRMPSVNVSLWAVQFFDPKEPYNNLNLLVDSETAAIMGYTASYPNTKFYPSAEKVAETWIASLGADGEKLQRIPVSENGCLIRSTEEGKNFSYLVVCGIGYVSIQPEEEASKAYGIQP